MGLTSLALSTSLAALAYSTVRSTLIDQRESAALRQAYTNARVVRSAFRAADPDITGLLSGLQVGSDGGAVVVAGAESFSSSVELGTDDLPAALVAGVADGRAGRQRVDGDAGLRLLVGVPIAAVGASYYEVTSLADLERTLEVLASSLAVGAAVATAVGATVGMVVSGSVLRPLRRITRVARRIVDGELESRLDAEEDRDLAPLADAFNQMLDELRERIRRESRFASDVAHEVRGPLTVLATAVDVVERRRSDLPPEAARAVAALDAQVQSFNRLVLDLLEISRFETGTAELATRQVDIEQLVGAVVAERKPPRPGVENRDGPGLRVELDPRRIRQVLTNLLDNADNYARGATAVLIDRAPTGHIQVSVEDHGPGVGAHERRQIFERFARGSAAAAPSAPRGSGLGLALCVNHVRLHGGRITVEDTPMGGARFVVELPEEPT